MKQLNDELKDFAIAMLTEMDDSKLRDIIEEFRWNLQGDWIELTK